MDKNNFSYAAYVDSNTLHKPAFIPALDQQCEISFGRRTALCAGMSRSAETQAGRTFTGSTAVGERRRVTSDVRSVHCRRSVARGKLETRIRWRTVA
jgi:hypothetical protein